MSYPFLNDRNEQDYLFTQLLCAQAPHCASHGNLGQEWKKFNKQLKETKSVDGTSYPFANIGENTARTRLTQFQEIMTYRIDKIGARKAPSLWSNDEDEDQDNDIEPQVHNCTATRGIAANIRANLEMIFEDLDNIENEKVRLTEEAQQKEWAEKGQVDDVKASALGHLHAVMAFRDADKSNSHPSMPGSPLVSRSNVALLGEQSAETTPSVARVGAQPVTTHRLIAKVPQQRRWWDHWLKLLLPWNMASMKDWKLRRLQSRSERSDDFSKLRTSRNDLPSRKNGLKSKSITSKRSLSCSSNSSSSSLIWWSCFWRRPKQNRKQLRVPQLCRAGLVR